MKTWRYIIWNEIYIYNKRKYFRASRVLPWEPRCGLIKSCVVLHGFYEIVGALLKIVIFLANLTCKYASTCDAIPSSEIVLPHYRRAASNFRAVTFSWDASMWNASNELRYHLINFGSWEQSDGRFYSRSKWSRPAIRCIAFIIQISDASTILFLQRSVGLFQIHVSRHLRHQRHQANAARRASEQASHITMIMHRHGIEMLMTRLSRWRNAVAWWYAASLLLARQAMKVDIKIRPYFYF